MKKKIEINWNNITNSWKRIQSFISLKIVESSEPTVLTFDNGDTTTNP